MAPPKDREAEARKEAGVGIGLADDLRHVRTALVKAYLAGEFQAAFDLMLFQMGRSVFTFGYKADALDITVRETPDRPTTRMNDADFTDWSPGELMLADRSGLSMDWLEIEDDGESFAALRALPVPDKKALFAACVARTVKPQLAFEPQARPELEATVGRLGIDFASHVRPTAAMLWSRIAKARILDIARTVFGISWASARAKTKKAALAEAMETAFAAGDRPVSLSAGMHAAALAWTPPGFAAFDTGRIGDEADSVDSAETPVPADTVETDPAEQPDPTKSGADSGTAPAEPEPTPSGGDAVDTRAATDETAVSAGSEAIEADPPAADVQDGIASQAGPVNGRDPSADPLEIPEFLRRVH